MGCLSNRKKQTEGFTDQKWDYINLGDFKSKGCGSVFAYGYLWFSLILSVTVYGVDSFTAVQLLAFNRWSSQIQPAIPLHISKWIFSVCIILSFVNIGFEGIRAIRVMKRGNVAECYMDNLAVRWESTRFGSGQGWKRFLVFAELTKSKKGAEYVALFTYFSFQSWIRVIFCSGPRQVLNALTLRSVYVAQLAVSSGTVGGSIEGFFDKIRILAQSDFRQAAILSGMLFTLVIWVFSALYLISAVLFYVFFLFHWIPRSDGGLTGYCERKVTKALLKIVTKTVNKALAKGQAERMRAAMKGEKAGMHPDVSLPTLPDVVMLTRQDTMSTLPPTYSSRPATPGHADAAAMDWQRPPPSRTATMASKSTYSSQAPLVPAAADMGYGSSDPANFPADNLDFQPPPPTRSGTGSSQRSYASVRQIPSHMRNDSGSILHQSITESPSMNSETVPQYTEVQRQSAQRNMGTFDSQPYGGHSWQQPPARQYGAYDSSGRPPAVPPQNPLRFSPPARSATGLVPARGPGFPPQRTMTAPMPSHDPIDNYYPRSEAPQTMTPYRPPIAERSGAPQAMAPTRPAFHERSITSQSRQDNRYRYDIEAQYNSEYNY